MDKATRAWGVRVVGMEEKEIGTASNEVPYSPTSSRFEQLLEYGAPVLSKIPLEVILDSFAIPDELFKK